MTKLFEHWSLSFYWILGFGHWDFSICGYPLSILAIWSKIMHYSSSITPLDGAGGGGRCFV